MCLGINLRKNMHILYGASFNTSLKAINTPKYNLAYMKT